MINTKFWNSIEFKGDKFRHIRIRDIDMDDELIIIILEALKQTIGHKLKITSLINKIKKNKISSIKLEKEVYKLITNVLHATLVMNPRADILLNANRVIIAIYPEELSLMCAKLVTIKMK